MIRLRSLEAWGVCESCGDSFSVFFWVRSGKDGLPRARIEPNREIKHDENGLLHRCGGNVRLINLPYPLILEER
jgi:hypothetical protein